MQISYSAWHVEVSAQPWQVTQSPVPSQLPPPELDELLDAEDDELLDAEDDELPVDDDEDDEELPPPSPPVPPLLVMPPVLLLLAAPPLLAAPVLDELLVLPPFEVPLPFLPVCDSESSNSEPSAQASGSAAIADNAIAAIGNEIHLI